MPLETASYIKQLDVNNPAATDFLAQADDHLRLIKTVLKNTFPNLDGPVTATSTQLSTAVTSEGGGMAALQITAQSAVDEGGEIVLQGAANYANAPAAIDNHRGTFRIFRPGFGAAVTVDTANGHINTSGKVRESGFDLIPRGFIGMWSGTVENIPAGWGLCNGAIQNGLQTPDLRDRFIMGAGSTYVAHQKGGTHNGQATTSTDGNHSHDGVTSVVGGHSHGGATGATVLRVDQLPPHDHELWSDDLSGAAAGGAQPDYRPAGRGMVVGTTGPRGNGNAHDHSVAVDGTHGHQLSTYTGGAHSHTMLWDNRPAYFALAFIIKL